MAIELSNYDTATGSEEGRWIEPVDFNGKKIGIRIKVFGPDSKKYFELKDAVQKQMYQAIASLNNGLEPKDEEPEDVKEAKFYAALTIDWEALSDGEEVTWDGKPFPFSEKNAVTFYRSVPMVRSQIKAFCENRRNFMRPERGA